MAFETIIFSMDGGAARLTLNRPDRLNSFTVKMHEEIAAALDAIDADKTVRTLFITGAGRGFCAGQDLSDRAVSPGGASVDLGESVEKRYNPLIRRLTSLPTPAPRSPLRRISSSLRARRNLSCRSRISASCLTPEAPGRCRDWRDRRARLALR